MPPAERTAGRLSNLTVWRSIGVVRGGRKISPLNLSRRKSYVIWLAVYGSVLTRAGRYQVPQIAAVEPIDEMLEQRQGEQ